MNRLLFSLLIIILFTLFVSNLMWGSVQIPINSVIDILMGQEVDKASWTTIVLQSRLPQAITAIVAGASVSVAGLLLQSVFNNPLAGPSVLGIDTGASLGVAVAMLIFGSSFSVLPEWLMSFGQLPIIASAFVGSFVVLSIIMLFSNFIKSNLMVLIIGIMMGYFTSSLISVMNFFADQQGVHAYTIWGMGNFSSVSLSQLPSFVLVTSVALFLSFLCIKPLNTLLLGARYAESLGVNIKRLRLLLLSITGLLIAMATAYCGPVSFIGLVVPHIARLALRTSNHRVLLPATLIIGSSLALLCNLISNWPGSTGVIPLNAITPLIGAPIILYVIIYQKKIEYFN